jgi:Tfp pilus assembly protein PilN
MRTHINLSRRPFTNHRLLWIVLVAAYFIAFWLFLWMTAEKGRVLAKQTELTQRIEGQKQAAKDAADEQERRKREQQKIVLTEQQAMQLASARRLIQRKVFSWNRMIGDIEEYVPKNTRIMSIKVAEIVNTADEVMARVEVKALGTTPDEMTAMMSNLQQSGGLFIVGETGQEASTETGETPFTLSLIYKPSRGDAR